MARVIKLLRDGSVWRSLLAEALGTFFLVFVGTGSCISEWEPGFYPTTVHIAFAFGLIVASMAQTLGHVSGCHINPAVTCGMMATHKMHPIRGCCYVLAQSVGAIAGSALVKGLTPTAIQHKLGLTLLHPMVTPAQGFLVEFLITFVLVLVIFGVSDENRDDVKGSAPLAIGLAITGCHLMAIKYTGSSMNPARTLGPAVIIGNWHEHWLYWVGPCLGGVVASLLYHHCFRAPSPICCDEAENNIVKTYSLIPSKIGNEQEKGIIVDRNTSI